MDYNGGESYYSLTDFLMTHTGRSMLYANMLDLKEGLMVMMHEEDFEHTDNRYVLETPAESEYDIELHSKRITICLYEL